MMRIAVLLVTGLFILATGTAMACPMQTASSSQTVASSNANSTPIPAKAQRANNG